MDKEDKLFLSTFTILLLLLILLNVVVGGYAYDMQKVSFDAEHEQCLVTLNNYENNEVDLINYERTSADKAGYDAKEKLERCRKIINNPELLFKGYIIGFWVMAILINLLLLFAIFGLSASVSNDFA